MSLGLALLLPPLKIRRGYFYPIPVKDIASGFGQVEGRGVLPPTLAIQRLQLQLRHRVPPQPLSIRVFVPLVRVPLLPLAQPHVALHPFRAIVSIHHIAVQQSVNVIIQDVRVQQEQEFPLRIKLVLRQHVLVVQPLSIHHLQRAALLRLAVIPQIAIPLLLVVLVQARQAQQAQLAIATQHQRSRLVQRVPIARQDAVASRSGLEVVVVCLQGQVYRRSLVTIAAPVTMQELAAAGSGLPVVVPATLTSAFSIRIITVRICARPTCRSLHVVVTARLGIAVARAVRSSRGSVVSLQKSIITGREGRRRARPAWLTSRNCRAFPAPKSP